MARELSPMRVPLTSLLARAGWITHLEPHRIEAMTAAVQASGCRGPVRVAPVRGESGRKVRLMAWNLRAEGR